MWSLCKGLSHCIRLLFSGFEWGRPCQSQKPLLPDLSRQTRPGAQPWPLAWPRSMGQASWALDTPASTNLFVLLRLLPPPPPLQGLPLSPCPHHAVQGFPQNQVPVVKPPHACSQEVHEQRTETGSEEGDKPGLRLPRLTGPASVPACAETPVSQPFSPHS